MTELSLSVAEPFSSPAWGSNFVVFTSETGQAIPEDRVKEYLDKACKYAKNYGTYLVPERFMLMGYHCMCLIDAEGKILGAQKAAYLNLANRLGKRGSKLEIFRTEFGGIFLCVDTDVYHPEVCRFASDMGAEIIICSQYIPSAKYGSHLVVAGCWNVSQLTKSYVVAVSGQFNCVCAPLAISARSDGFIVPPNLKLPMTSRLNSEKLFSVASKFALNRKFYSIHRNELLG